MHNKAVLKPLFWDDGCLRLLDQRLLPHEEKWLDLTTWQEVRSAITDMAVRGAPAIGICAAYGMALAAKNADDLESARLGLASARPTAVNLAAALDRIMEATVLDFEGILSIAKAMEREDLDTNLAIGKNGAKLVPDNANVLTICNTGSIATAGHGTALGIIRTAHEQGKVRQVWSCETRPRLQGLKLTAWELMKDEIPFCSVVDSAAAALMRSAQVDIVIVGADRIATNGDTANKIGTYMLAILAKHHGVPFIVAAPRTTFDLTALDGSRFVVEERGDREITQIEEVRLAPEGCPVFNPAFDVTPGELLTYIVDETGVHEPPYAF